MGERRPLLRRLTAAPLIALVWVYRVTLGPLMGGHCRFDPTCSQYALDALTTLPTHRAAYLIVRRLLRCHPLGGCGYDPVPSPRRKTASR